MKAYPLRAFIHLGTTVRYLQDILPGVGVHGNGRIINNLTSFHEQVKVLGLKVTDEACYRLRRIEPELQKYEQDQGILPKHASELREAMELVRETLYAEASTFNAYTLTDKKWPPKQLVENPESFLRKQTFAKLPSVAQYDFKQCGKCIAFETPTAAAFHLLRATEDTLRTYYRHFIRRGRLEKPTWGEIIKALRAKTRKPKPDKVFLDHLDNIRHNFRKPTDHPDKIYGLDEVQDLFGLVTDVLNRMASVLP